MPPKISLQDTAALPYIEEAAASLREQMLALLREYAASLLSVDYRIKVNVPGVGPFEANQI